MTTASMDSIHIYVVCDSAEAAKEDKQFAAELSKKLPAEIRSIVENMLDETDYPVVVPIIGFENIPTPKELGALSIVLVVLPDRSRGFGAIGVERLQKIRDIDPSHPTFEARILPIDPADNRVPPQEPLQDVVGLKAKGLAQEKLTEIAKIALIHAALGVSSSSRSVFISYRQSDGTAVAKRLAKKLKERNYAVWRDGETGDDGMRQLIPGSDAQKAIKESMLKQSLVLLIDTPEAAALSDWVEEEVGIAFGNLLPLLPIVINGAAHNGSPPDIPTFGGRFPSVRSLGNEVRLESEALGSESHDLADKQVDEHLDQIERQIAAILLAHQRSRRRLIVESQRRFKELHYTWEKHLPEFLMFRAEKAIPRATVRKRFLVHCTPYGALAKDIFDLLGEKFEERPEENKTLFAPFNYAILVHNGITAYRGDIKNFLAGRTFMIVLRPHEISAEKLDL